MEEQINTFYQKILNFSKNRFKENRFSHLTDEGLNTYNKMPGVLSASLFMMNDETYEFVHSRTQPEQEEARVTEIFPKLVENGIIGASLRSVEMYFNMDGTSTYDGLNYFAIPLLGSKGAYGMIILTSNKSTTELPHDLIKSTNLFTLVFAASLENLILLQKYKKSQELLDQQVAFRTMKLVESQKKLADKFEDLKSNLSMSIPHEVRTPINQILGFSDFLMKYYDTTEIEDAHEMLNDINSSAKRLKGLFENYLYYANLSILATNVYDIMNLQQMVTPSIESIIYDSIAYKAEEAGRLDDFKMEIEDLTLAISESYIKKVIDEIVDNSLKYSEKGSPIVIVTHRIEDESISPIGVCHISIKDHGRGMTTEHIQSLDAYMQFDRKVHEQQGSGLGISIVQRIIDLHNGYFNINSELGKYTEVIVKIPLSNKTDDDM